LNFAIGHCMQARMLGGLALAVAAVLFFCAMT